MRVAVINVTASLSTGRIAVALCRMAAAHGDHPLLCYARDYPPGDFPSYKICGKLDTYLHVALARLTDRSGFFSKRVTRRLVRQLRAFKPDLIHLHNIHGYYLHLPTLFQYLREQNLPVLWTLHDCWAYTGHCAYYTMAQGASPLKSAKRRYVPKVGCERWLGGCGHCPLKRAYPASLLLDQSARNWREKRALFTGLKHLVLAVPSEWLKREVERSFLGGYPVYALPNGLDLTQFTPSGDEAYAWEIYRFYKLDKLLDKSKSRRLIVSVAAVWDERKGLDDLIELAEALGDEYCIVAVGVDEYQKASLPPGTVTGLLRTNNIKDLCVLYTYADLYVSLSREETMGMTLVEALACGTQALCYDATAMPEIITPEVGETVPVGDIEAAADAVRRLCDAPKSPKACRKRAMAYDADKRFGAYIRLYDSMYRHSPAYLRAVEEGERRRTEMAKGGAANG